MGNYPTAKECVHELTDPNCINTGAAFHREFAFIKGPVDTLFLAYKEDLIGVIPNGDLRSEEHTSELQSLMRNSYAVFCLKKKNYQAKNNYTTTHYADNINTTLQDKLTTNT